LYVFLKYLNFETFNKYQTLLFTFILIFTFAITIFQKFFLNILIGQRRFVKVFIIGTISGCTKFFLIFTTLFLTKKGIYVVLSYGLATLVGFLLAIHYNHKIKLSFNMPNFKKIYLGELLFLTITSFFPIYIYNISILITKSCDLINSVGVLSLITTFSSIPSITFSGITNAILPNLTYDDNTSRYLLKEYWNIFLDLFILFLIPMIIFLSAISLKYLKLFKLFNKYLEIYRFLPIFLFNNFLLVIQSVLFNFYIGVEEKAKKIKMTFIYLIIIALNLLLNILLINQLNILGAGLSMMFTLILMIVFYFYRMARESFFNVTLRNKVKKLILAIGIVTIPILIDLYLLSNKSFRNLSLFITIYFLAFIFNLIINGKYIILKLKSVLIKIK
jgi:O-antigen/teichoic acid export membrane protein